MPDNFAVMQRVAAFRASLPSPEVCAHARQVVLIASSSRGGSTIFAEMLRRNRALLHFRAEINPQLRLFGCEGGKDDAVPVDHPVPSGLSAALGADCGQPTNQLPDARAVEAFSAEIAARLTIQWPEVEMVLSPVLEEVHSTLAELRAQHRWEPGMFHNAAEFYGLLLPRLHARWPGINPAAYDIDRQRLPVLYPSFSPEFLVEEPPFVLPVPWKHATEAELQTMPLVIKTPSTAYRLAWMAELFPRARIRILHLTRNAAASINGLYDGWRFPGFHSHDVGHLAIEGYSECVPGGGRWWKFDRPPGWNNLRNAPLPEVCAHQWASAHEAILNHPEPDRISVRFEDIVGTPVAQAAAVGRLASWLGLPIADDLARTLHTGLPIVMATAQPRHRRWFDRSAIIEPMCRTERIRNTMNALGYPPNPDAWE